MKFQNDCVQELKREIESRIEEMVVALRRREEDLKKEVDVVGGGEDVRGGWKVVGEWAGLEKMIDRCGGLMRRRKRNESFEVIWQENMETVDKMKENVVGVVDEDEDDDDDDENEGFIFKFKNEKCGDQTLLKLNCDSNITQVKHKQPEVTKNADNNTYNKHQNEQNIECSDNKDLIDSNSGSFIFKLAQKLEEIKENVKNEDMSSFKFTFDDDDRSHQPLNKSENLKNNSYNDDDISCKINLTNYPVVSQDTDYSAEEKKENSFKCYKFDLNNDNKIDLKIKNNSLFAIEPFLFKLEEMIETPKLSNKKDDEKIELECLSETFCFRLMDGLKIEEENENDSFCFNFNSLSSSFATSPLPSPFQYQMGLCE